MHDKQAQKSNSRAASIRIEARTAQRLGGQRKHDLRIGRKPDYVDVSRSHLNRVIIEPAKPADMRFICSERRRLGGQHTRAMKSNAAVATCGIITFGVEAARMFDALPPDQQDEAFLELAQAAARRLETSVHGLVVHCDESTIHAHFQLAAYDWAGQPLSKTTRPAVLSELQDIAAEIMSSYCPAIERGRRYGDRIEAGATRAETLHKSVRELHQTLPSDLEAAQARVAEMQTRVANLEARAELSNREAKRLETYKKRLADRIAEEERLAKIRASEIINDAKAEAATLKERLAAKLRSVNEVLVSLKQMYAAGVLRQNEAERADALAKSLRSTKKHDHQHEQSSDYRSPSPDF